MHAMIRQDLVSNSRAKYLGFSGVKDRVDLWSKHYTSLKESKRENKLGFVETEIERIHVTSSKSKLPHSVLISKENEFISMTAKYLGFSGVKGCVDLWSKHHTSLLQQGKCELVLLKQRLKGYM